MDYETTSGSGFQLPGFRFHPTEEELLDFYLKNMVAGKKLGSDIIGLLNIYHHDPWELPGLAKIGEREWYFFVHRDRRHGSGGRPNRTTATGFWKATGSDRKILSLSNPKKMIGLKKTLVFYKGRAPRGCKTDWIMNEYRLPDSCSLSKDIVLCKIYRKATSLKVLEQRAAMEEEKKTTICANNSPPPSMSPLESISHSSQQDDSAMAITETRVFKKDDEGQTVPDPKKNHELETSFGPIHTGKMNLAELQVPKFNMEWTQDPIWTQLRSPWLDNMSFTPYANVLNF